MEQYLDLASRFFSDFQSWDPPRLVVGIVLGFSVLSSGLMTRYITSSPMFAGPICFLVLMFSALLANFAARGQIMMGTSDVQKILLFTVLGQGVACLALFSVFKAGFKRVGR